MSEPLYRRARRLLQKTSPIHKDTALSDAEKLADIAGQYMAANISGTKSGNVEYEEWRDTLSDMKKKYVGYSQATFAKSDLVDVVGNSLIGRLRNLSIDPNHMLKWDLVHNNNLGASNLDELLQRKFGVISPLSGDYLMVSTYRQYLERKARK